MNTTTNYDLVEIELSDAPPDITVINPNWETIDTELKNLTDGKAPAGYGVGEDLYDNRINNPLDTSLKTGIYGLFNFSGVTNLPEKPFAGYVQILAVNSNYRQVTAVNLTNGHTFYNSLSGSSSWSGWGVLTGSKVEWFNRVPYIRNDGVINVGKYIDFHTADNTDIYTARITTVSPNEIKVGTAESNEISLWQQNSYTILSPTLPTYAQLGSTSYPFLSVYSQNGVITTSDRRKKKDIDYDISKYEGFFKDLKACSFNFKDDKEERKHIGFIAQDVYGSAVGNGLNKEDLFLLRKEPVFDEDKKEVEGEYIYGLNYSDFIALNTHMLQKAYKKIEELETKVATLEASLKKLEVLNEVPNN